jgi:hypothetical protein
LADRIRGQLEGQMVKLKSEKHHWWPKCVSQFWAAADGKTGWAKPDGSIIRVPPAKLAMIGNGHHVKLDPNGGSTPWDSSFEADFDKADNAFPRVISWIPGVSCRKEFAHPDAFR